MAIALYLRNHYGQVGVAAAAVYTATYTGAIHQAQKFASSYMSKTVDCVLHKDKDFRAICDTVNKQSKEIWDEMHTDHKNAMVERTQLSPIEMSSNVIKTSNAVTQWVQEAANCNKFLFICNNAKEEAEKQLSLSSKQTIEAKNEIIGAKNEAMNSLGEVAKAKSETIKIIKDSNPDQIRIGECKELENLKNETGRLKQVEKDHIKLHADYKNLETLYNKLVTESNALKADHKVALKKCGSWCV